MKPSYIASLSLPIGLLLAAFPAATANAADARLKSRVFALDYGATIQGLSKGARVRVWVPVPESDHHQTVTPGRLSLPAKPEINREPTYGNKILYFETFAGQESLSFSTSYQIRRAEVRGLQTGQDTPRLTARERKLFLSPNAKVPIKGKQLELLTNRPLQKDPLAAAGALFEIVDNHVRYDKSRPGFGHGDVLWVCDSRFGNCTDFHSLFISLARSQGLPARFEIGFPLPAERSEGKIAGYHCWASFYVDSLGWVPVDISEADKNPALKRYYFGNLTEHRVSFTTGRDIELVPKQDGDPLNYFVYPYVEVDGIPWTEQKIRTRFNFRDVP